MEPVDELALVVGLEAGHLQAHLLTPPLAEIHQLFERRGAVDLRSAGAEEVQVGAVDDHHPVRRRDHAVRLSGSLSPHQRAVADREPLVK